MSDDEVVAALMFDVRFQFAPQADKLCLEDCRLDSEPTGLPWRLAGLASH